MDGREPDQGRRDPWLAVLALLAVGQYAVLAPHLLYPDVALGYPFPGGDSLSWLLSALALGGAPVGHVFRPPVLPLVLAGLSRLGWLSVFPLLGLAFQHAAALGTHVVLRRRFGRPAAFVSGLLVLFCASVLLLAVRVMADLPAAILLGASSAAFLAAGRNPRRYGLAGLLGGLSAVTQQAALLLPLPMAITVIAVRRGHLRKASLWVGAAAFAVFPVAWFVAKKLAAGAFLDVGVKQWGLLGFHPLNAPYYLVAALSFWGWPALALAVAGAVSSGRAVVAGWQSADRDPDEIAWALFPLFTVAVLVLFFTLFYDFQAKRFLVYAFFPALALVARALWHLARSRALVPVAVLTVLIAAWPLGSSEVAANAAVWPLPPAELVVPTGSAFSNPVPRWKAARLETVDWATVEHRTLWSRVLRAARHRPAPAAPPVSLPDDARVAIYVLGSGPGTPGAYDSLTRLGYVARRPVTVVSPELYPPGWWGWRSLEPLGLANRFRLFDWRPPGAPAAIVAFDKRDPRGARLARRARSHVGSGPVPPRRHIREVQRIARRVGALVEPNLGTAVVLPGAVGEWTRFLPLFMRNQVLIPDASTAARLRAQPESCRPATRVRLLEVARCRLGPVDFELVWRRHRRG